MESVSMGDQLCPRLTSPSTMQSGGCAGLWDSGDVLSEVTNNILPSGNPIDQSGFGGCQEYSSVSNVAFLC